MKFYALLWGSILVFTPVYADEIQTRPALTKLEVAQLQNGEMIFREAQPTEKPGVAFMAAGLVEHPTKQVWPVIRDCEHYHKFMPRTVVSERRERKGRHSLCYVKLSMPFPLSDLESLVNSYETISGDGRYRRHWNLIKGSYTRNNGSWTVYPFGPQNQMSLLVYRIDINPSMSVPDFMIRKAQRGSLPEIFDAIRARTRMIKEGEK